MGDQVVITHAGDGQPIWMLGGLYEIKAQGSETGGALTVVEMQIPAGMGPPPHTHNGAEAVYVLEGTINYHIAGEVHQGQAGSFFYIPEGVIENFEPTSDCRILVFYAPSGIENFFREAGEEAPSHELPPPLDGPPDLEALVAIAAKHGMTIAAPEHA
jgi:quercetin dioxygenase-like cupin family protein